MAYKHMRLLTKSVAINSKQFRIVWPFKRMQCKPLEETGQMSRPAFARVVSDGVAILQSDPEVKHT